MHCFAVLVGVYSAVIAAAAATAVLFPETGRQRLLRQEDSSCASVQFYPPPLPPSLPPPSLPLPPLLVLLRRRLLLPLLSALVSASYWTTLPSRPPRTIPDSPPFRYSSLILLLLFLVVLLLLLLLWSPLPTQSAQIVNHPSSQPTSPARRSPRLLRGSTSRRSTSPGPSPPALHRHGPYMLFPPSAPSVRPSAGPGGQLTRADGLEGQAARGNRPSGSWPSKEIRRSLLLRRLLASVRFINKITT